MWELELTELSVVEGADAARLRAYFAEQSARPRVRNEVAETVADVVADNAVAPTRKAGA
jgi:hypothetical protein